MYRTARLCTVQRDYVPYSETMYRTATLCTVQRDYVPYSETMYRTAPPYVVFSILLFPRPSYA